MGESAETNKEKEERERRIMKARLIVLPVSKKKKYYKNILNEFIVHK